MSEINNDNNNGTNNSRVLAGLFIIGVGIIFFLKQAGIFIFPYWLFTWPMLLIAIGIYSGVKHDFRGGGWLVMIVIGGFFLLEHVLNIYSLRPYLVPIILVIVGIMLIVRPKQQFGWKNKNKKWNDWYDNSFNSNKPGNPTDTNNPASGFTTAAPDGSTGSSFTFAESEKLDATAIFGTVKKNIMSKNFLGGEATSIFGGSEIDMSQADINGTIRVDVTAILGGVKLIVPSHWTVRQEITAIFGGVEDKRHISSSFTVQNKVLVLSGTVFMGGIEIVSYR